MTRIVAGLNQVGRTLGGGKPPRRVLTLLLHFDTNLAPVLMVSEAIGNNIRFHHIWVDAVWLSYTALPRIEFQVSTGTGAHPVWNDVQAWQDIIPVRWEGGEGAFGVTPEMCKYSFSMDRPFAEAGRRFGVWGRMTGEGECNLMVSAEIEEI